MKIGIVTCYRSHNYGALLQAIALRATLENMGHEAYFVDYFPWWYEKWMSIFDTYNFKYYSWKGKIKYVLRFMHSFVYKYMRRRTFFRFINEYVDPYCRPTTDEYDYIIYGSDQIWRKVVNMGEYDPVYFGKNDFKTKHHISYAASVVKLPDNEYDEKVFLELILHVEKLSVREVQVKEYIESHTSRKAQVHLDPTLLLTRQDWESVFPLQRVIKDRYLLLFDLQRDGGVAETFNLYEVNRFADSLSLPIVHARAEATGYATKTDRQYANPMEFLSLVKYADFVITSSYHGIVFSILFNRQFLCCLPSGRLRAENLLGTLGISRCLLQPNATFPVRYEKIVYDSVNIKMVDYKKSSIDYLKGLSL